MAPLALVTGAAHRLGKVFALDLARQGFDIVLHYHHSSAAALPTGKEIESLGQRAIPVQANLADPSQITALLSSMETLKVLVNSAATKFPYDKGIAGYVFMTGQPIATSNVREDKRFNQDFAKSTGYIPDSILATPLISSDDRIIGVMEVLDKIDETSFDLQDMDLLGMFAQQAAMAIDMSQQIDSIEQTLIQGLKRLAKSDKSQDSSDLQSVLNQALSGENRPSDLLELADLFNDISALGEAERKVCIQVLNTFAEYRRSTSAPRRFSK